MLANAHRRPTERSVARIAPLAKLPVFLDLAGRRVVVAGGSPAAAWKAELLAAAGAKVTALSAKPDAELRGLAPATVTLVHRDWQASDLDGAAVAVLDAQEEDEAASFAAAGRARGALVNVIDDPAFCDFQFGAIVNRSPVIVGISTDGAAPILGQAIRRRVEALLPADLAMWAAAARRLRGRIAAELATSGARRAFWERFVDLAFATPPGAAPEDRLAALLGAQQDGAGSGRVTLVGAGPGDAELLTLKAVRALQAADVILFDDLVPTEVLDLARREATRLLVGKRGGRPSCRQEDINDLLVHLALAGRRVVRLKSGDPMVFGRAGEEIAELRRAGVPVEVVPGITAALAMAAALGVSLTHRELAHSVRFVTGHGRHGALADDLDWRGLADPGTTLIVYMGGRTAATLAGRLMAEGLAPRTPACAIAAVGRPAEVRWSGPLAGLEHGVVGLGEGQPVLIGIGRVFSPATAAGVAGPYAPQTHATAGQ